MKFSIVSAALTLLTSSLLALAAPAIPSPGTNVLPPGFKPATAPPAGIQLFNATAGYNATHGLPYDKNAHGRLIPRDLVARQAYSGQATWFYPGLGACGGYNYDYEYVVALDDPLWDNGANCWRGITIQAYGQQVNAAIVDLCPSCGYGSLDLAPGLFQAFTSLDTGVFDIVWWYR